MRSVVLFDLDKFKKINDAKGHVLGDRMLTKTTQIIREQICDTDAVGRYGGEELLVLLPDTGLGRLHGSRAGSGSRCDTGA